jgi:hypothetical protein
MTSSVKSNDDFICPITYQIFRDPVIAGDGYTYERAAIVRWILENGTSPFTRQPLNLNELQADDYLKNLAAQRRSSSTSSNYNVNLDQSVLQRQNSTMSCNNYIYIDPPILLQQQTILNNNVSSINNIDESWSNRNIRKQYYSLVVIIITSVIALVITFVLYRLYFGSIDHDYSGK